MLDGTLKINYYGYMTRLLVSVSLCFSIESETHLGFRHLHAVLILSTVDGYCCF